MGNEKVVFKTSGKGLILVQMEENRIHVVDYLKGFSIFTIVLMYFIQMMSAVPDKLLTLTKIGGTGVHVFFVCSGLGLYLSKLQKNDVS